MLGFHASRQKVSGSQGCARFAEFSTFSPECAETGSLGAEESKVSIGN